MKSALAMNKASNLSTQTEFSLINQFFQSIARPRQDVVFGIGDDAGCLEVPADQQLLVSCDTLIADVHFCQDWDPYDIAYKAVMVNVSDIAAMGGQPAWVSLALTLPAFDESWLARFSAGLRDALNRFQITLIGGDTTRGPLSMTLTIHGLVPRGGAVRRCGAKPCDLIFVTGELGAAALAVKFLTDEGCDERDKALLMEKLKHPSPRIDFLPLLQSYATAAIDISDGLTADLNHICVASRVGASLWPEAIPVHPLVHQYLGDKALDFAVSGGDDYELCFTVSSELEKEFIKALADAGLKAYAIGIIEDTPGMRPFTPRGYQHF